MNAQHGKQLEAVINGHRCVFDGDLWNSSDPQLDDRLNRALLQVPLPRVGLFEVADEVIHRLGESAVARILPLQRTRPCGTNHLRVSKTQLPSLPRAEWNPDGPSPN